MTRQATESRGGDDFLLDAARALREQGDSGQAPAGTRARILGQLVARRRERRQKGVAVRALAVVLAGSASWAQRTYQLFTPVVSSLREALGGPGADRAERHVPVSVAPATSAAPLGNALAPPTAEPAQVEETRGASQPAPGTARVANAAAVSRARSAAIRPPAHPEDAEAKAAREQNALFRAAHEAHFVRRDPAAALAAWQRYLNAFPDGALAPEARYNRALCLARLGRRTEAAAALAPFADAPAGSYRQREASQLRDAFEHWIER